MLMTTMANGKMAHEGLASSSAAASVVDNIADDDGGELPPADGSAGVRGYGLKKRSASAGTDKAGVYVGVPGAHDGIRRLERGWQRPLGA
jgi:hypothetical protein